MKGKNHLIFHPEGKSTPRQFITPILLIWFTDVHSMDLAAKSAGKTIWSEYAVGITLNETAAVVRYMPGLKHSMPVGLNLLSNILSSQKLPDSHGNTIVTKITNNWPARSKPYHVPKSKINCSLFAIFNICSKFLWNF